MSDMPGMPETGKSENVILLPPSPMNLTSSPSAATLSGMSQKGTTNSFVSAATQLAGERSVGWDNVTIIKCSGDGYILHQVGCGGAWKDTEHAEWVDHTSEGTFPEIVEIEYAGHLRDDPSATWRTYQDEFNVKPCLDHLSKGI